MKGLVAILGAGESGVGAAILAKKKGFEVFELFQSKKLEMAQRLLKKISVEEQNYLIDMLEKMVTGLNNRKEEPA